jgi:hypothetical protein
MVKFADKHAILHRIYTREEYRLYREALITRQPVSLDSKQW